MDRRNSGLKSREAYRDPESHSRVPVVIAEEYPSFEDEAVVSGACQVPDTETVETVFDLLQHEGLVLG